MVTKRLIQNLLRRLYLFLDARSRAAHLHDLQRCGRVTIGRHTYGVPNCSYGEGDSARIIIGSFVSIAPGVTFIPGGIHPSDYVSLFPFRARWKLPGAYKDGIPATKGDIIVGSDVWIGTDAMILSGVRIGHGVIVATRSVLTKDVPPHAIVGGAPADVIKYRFPPEVIAQLL